LVQILNNALAAAQGLQQIPTLLVAGQELAPYVHSPGGRALLALPGQIVPFVRGAIIPAQVAQHRPSYINAILIQSRGHVQDPPCARCARPGGLRPFVECRRIQGHFGGCCGNCKWPDHGIRCTARDNDDDDSSDSSDDSDLEIVGVRAIEGSGAAANPVVIA
jgi:Protein of unknown function (DUF3716)